ncbi:hypothetical protein M011DRAFT_460520 [Sporormia fimetaria CBS 119925]|uniref:Uncharacterized protein n=1 Tax=Sporormia fimetaria CBS 119925 TaxID=1340428 RepID=A0A6A6V4Q7_9PLEO|nr:hypothetical protein M011DRAFT_460520 [Sporormia fimetaria CBS 119925]
MATYGKKRGLFGMFNRSNRQEKPVLSANFAGGVTPRNLIPQEPPSLHYGTPAQPSGITGTPQTYQNQYQHQQGDIKSQQQIGQHLLQPAPITSTSHNLYATTAGGYPTHQVSPHSGNQQYSGQTKQALQMQPANPAGLAQQQQQMKNWQVRHDRDQAAQRKTWWELNQAARSRREEKARPNNNLSSKFFSGKRFPVLKWGGANGANTGAFNQYRGDVNPPAYSIMDPNMQIYAPQSVPQHPSQSVPQHPPQSVPQHPPHKASAGESRWFRERGDKYPRQPWSEGDERKMGW